MSNEAQKLVQLLKTAAAEDDSGDESWYDRFVHIDDFMNAEVHPHVSIGPARGEQLWLNDHGADHISTVMRRAGELVFNGDTDTAIVTPHEIYVLLVAIHLHDVGNLWGREDHEKKVTEVMELLGEVRLGTNTFDRRMIRDIAMAHGGAINGTKDTIGQLRYPDDTDGVRVPLLAAILRLADELADDHTRTSRFLMLAQSKEDLFKGSEIFHQYSDRLRRVKVDAGKGLISLVFQVDKSLLLRTFAKAETQVFLFDEIVSRAKKVHRERTYCSRYLRPFVHFDQIVVSVEICESNYMKVLEKIDFALHERGYPADMSDAEFAEAGVQHDGKSLSDKYSAPIPVAVQ